MGLLQPHGRGGPSRRQARLSGRRVIIHSLGHARAALMAAKALGVPLTLASAEGAGCYGGPLWFKALIEEARREHPDVAVTAILDCADEPGTALGALRAGLACVRFTGREDVAAKLAAIAAERGAALETGTADRVLDLLDARDPEALCRAFLAGNESIG